MTKLTVLLNPEDVNQAKKHLDTILNGRFLLPNTFQFKVENKEVEHAINSLDYILAGIDFQVIEHHVKYNVLYTY